MKLIFTLVVIFSVATKISAQKISDEARIALGIDMIASSQQHLRIKTGCSIWSDNNYVRPLLVIDGIPDESAQLQKLDPDNIVSIDILKEAECTAIFGNKHLNGVLIITTKAFYLKKFIVKDFLSGEKIPAATIRFISIKDTINTVADENGSLITDKLKAGIKYDVTVSSTGYKKLTTIVTGKEQEILLERDIRECGNVIVWQTNCWTKRTSCSYANSKIITEKDPADEDKVMIRPAYPNPVQRNNVFNLEFTYTQDETMQLAVISMNGSMVSLQSKKIMKGLNHLSITADAKWAGIYNIQLRNEKGTLIRQEKLVVQ